MIKQTALTIAVSAALTTTAIAEPIRQYPDESTQQKPTTRVIVKYKEGIVTSQGASSAGGARIFEVDETDAEAFVQQLKNRPEVDEVATDVIITHPPMPKPPERAPMVNGSSFQPSEAPSDPGFDQQISWQAPSGTDQGFQDTLRAYLETPREQTIRIGVLDSGFYETPELVWSEGYNITDIGLSEYGPEFYEDALNPDCTTPHGNAVAGILGATANNGLGVAGITNAELVAGRVLECNSGSLYDASVGIRWMAGDAAITDVPAISEPVDVINLSLGAQITDCPFYMQEAVDYATDRGILVVAAAGNDDIDAGRFAPASCNNVLSVGAVGRDGLGSDFSNFGDTVDVSALGELVGTLDENGEPSRWYGTSFAAPIVAGIGGLMKQANPALSANQIADIIVSTSRAQMDGSKDVAGIADAGQALDAVKAQLDANRPEIRSALNGVTRCNEAAYVNNAPAGVDFQSMYEVDASDISRDANTEFYAVFKTTGEGAKELVELSSEDVFVLNGVDLDQDQVWFDVCDSEAANCRFGQSLPL